MAIYFSSDPHFNHNKDFIFSERGFSSIEEMNETIIKNYNSIITDEDDLYILGDLCLGDLEEGKKCISQLNGKIHIVLGNHDTDNRIEMYKTLPKVVEIKEAIRLKYKKYHFFLTHFPCLTGNLQKETLKQMTLNLYGHTHQTTNFYENNFFMYHVGCDSHNCTPILLEDIIDEMNIAYNLSEKN